MDPIGTITNFYPFLTPETRETIKSALKTAEGYDDFVSRLVDIVLAQDITNDLSYFTTIHAVNTFDTSIFNRLRSRLRDDVVLRPWSFMLHEGTREEFTTGFPASYKLAFENPLENWVRLFLFLIIASSQRTNDPHRYLAKAKELIESHPDLNCFSAQLYIICGWDARDEADIKEAMNQFEKAIETAEHFDDVIRKADAQSRLAGCLKESDVFQALALLEDSYQTFKSLGAKHLTSSAARSMGLLHTTIGEYDLAVEFYLEAKRIAEPRGFEKYWTATVLSRLYCDIDLPEKGIEWIKWAMDCEDITPQSLKLLYNSIHQYFLLAVARLLIQLGQLEDIFQLLNESYKQILQRADEEYLLDYNFVSGLFEYAVGNLDEGLQSLVDALTEAERLKLQVYVNSILLALAKVELRNFKKLESGGTIESSGQWMTRLGIHAQEKNYPGIRMQHALLKAEYQEMIGETEAARLTLQDALTFTESLGVKTLRSRIQERLQKLEDSVDV